MAFFTKKTWEDRVAEFINRRTLTKEDGTEEIVTVARNEGTVSAEGDAFNAETMNNLEGRVEAGFNAVNESLTAEANNRNAEDVKLAASIAEVATSVSTVAESTNNANKTALSAIKARTKNIEVTVSNGIATIPFSSVSSDINTSNYVDALVDIFSSNDYIICRKWQSGTNIYAFIRNYDGTVLTSGNLTFQVTAFITM